MYYNFPEKEVEFIECSYTANVLKETTFNNVCVSSTEERVDVGWEQDVGNAGPHLQVSQLEHHCGSWHFADYGPVGFFFYLFIYV